jgi:hypothetical protein
MTYPGLSGLIRDNHETDLSGPILLTGGDRSRISAACFQARTTFRIGRSLKFSPQFEPNERAVNRRLSTTKTLWGAPRNGR